MKMPAGFQFSLTDEELVATYLTNRVKGTAIEYDFIFPVLPANSADRTPIFHTYNIPTVDVYMCERWELPSKSPLQDDHFWFFFCSSTKTYFTEWATGDGCWKAEKYLPVLEEGSGEKIGMKKTLVYYLKKTLVYYLGCDPDDERTEWVIHEYSLAEEDSKAASVSPDRLTLVLCQVVKMSEQDVEANSSQNLSWWKD